MNRTNLFNSLTGRYAQLFVISLFCVSGAKAQRIQQPLGRGVVAVQNGNNVTVTWRRLAQEAEDAKYNIYIKKSGASDFVKLNTSALSNTNYKTTTSVIPTGSELAVRVVNVSGDNTEEQELSVPFKFEKMDMRNKFMGIRFNNSPLENKSFDTKFCWPVDLDGNGEYDYVVDRNSVNSNRHYLEAYLADGTYLWTVDLGPNEWSSTGQDDQICAYDIDCDGYGEVIVQTSDGTRFWDKANNTWGLYVNKSITGDTDNDGIIDYDTQSTKNPPRYISVINGLTGEEKASVEQMYDEAYNRTNKSSLMGDEYNRHVGHVGIFYYDGIHPGLVMEWHTRTSGGAHQYRNSAFAFDFSTGKAENWHQLFMKRTGGSTFHQIRILDADGDGKDEMSSGAYCMDHDGSTLYDSGISHGDRHRTTDIDPERPGLETFSVQQYAGDMLGQILFDAGTGKPIKKWYLTAVGDIGRGECIDIDKSHLGWEMWSTMDGNIYDAKGDLIPSLKNIFPTEGVWWDSELDREIVQTSDSHYNVYIQDFFKGRLIEIAKESGYKYITSYGKRAKFWGDIIGDWREELILNYMENGVNVGIAGFTTDYTTAVNNIYCLQEDPHYRGDCTTKGYYQSPNPGFYLGYDMPRPQLPPCMVTDLVAKTDNTWTGYDHVTAAAYENGKSVLFDLTFGTGSFNLEDNFEPASIYAMPVKDQTITINGYIAGKCDFWKSQQGTIVLSGKNNSTGITYISEGTLQVDGEIAGTLDIRARGTLTGSGSVNDVTFEGALNYEGGRIMPTGTLTFKKGLEIDKKTYVELDINKGTLIKAVGDLNVTASTIFTIDFTSPEAGEYKLIEYSGNFKGDMNNFNVRGIVGLSYNIVNHDNAIWLKINEQREAAQGVKWTAAETSIWDYQTDNFMKDDVATTFVAEDGLYFGDEANNKTVQVDELMPTSRVEVNTEKTYTFNGEGGFSGTGMLVKNGSGKLILNTTKADYKGATVINSGTVTVKELADGGNVSSFGAASSSAENLKIGKATLIVNNTNTATNRGITLLDTATFQIPSGTTSLKGIIKGDGTLHKTGTGQLNITYAGSNSWAETILQSGILAMGTWNTTFGKSGSPIHVIGNSTIKMFDNNTSSAVPTLQNAIIIDKGKILTFAAGSRCTVKGSLLGEGTYKISFPYVRGDVYTNCSKFEGTYEVTSGQLRLRQAMDLSKGTLKLGAGVYAAGLNSDKNEYSYNHKIGSLTSTATDCTLSTGVWNVGYLGKDDTYAGAFSSAATLNKYGEGRLILSGSGAGKVNVYSGILEARNTSAPITTETISVRDGGTLEGTGQVNSIIAYSGGTVGAGNGTSVVGTLTVNGSLTMNSGSVLRIRTRSTSTKTNSDALDVMGNVKLNSTKIVFEEISSSGIFADDAELQIIKCDGKISLSGDVTIEPAMPKEGWKWDTSTLTSDGKIRVVADPTTAITSVSADELSSDDKIFDMSGRRVTLISESGSYIVNGKKVFVRK
ncbi:MAG: hypothetical protein K6E54_01600 [Bacteroidaceae bacterium]|nr:hypothetical protein [Bacteroidaceae bacterium]